MWERCRGIDASVPVLQTELQSRMRALVGFLEPYDALLTPGSRSARWRSGSLDTAARRAARDFRRSGYFTPFTAIFNASGQPAIALPLFHGDDGLPLACSSSGAGGEAAARRWPARSRRRSAPAAASAVS